MKVRRKSEIAEAVQWDGTEQYIFGVRFSPVLPFCKVGDWVVKDKTAPMGILIYSPEEFAAHYEPVPDMFSPAVTQFLDDVDLKRATPSVSEEQPAAFVKMSIGEITTTGGSISIGGDKIPAPHRATMAIVACKNHENCDFYFIERDGWAVLDEDGFPWAGREAEAKAKLESLSKNLAGEKG